MVGQNEEQKKGKKGKCRQHVIDVLFCMENAHEAKGPKLIVTEFPFHRKL